MADKNKRAKRCIESNAGEANVTNLKNIVVNQALRINLLEAKLAEGQQLLSDSQLEAIQHENNESDRKVEQRWILSALVRVMNHFASGAECWCYYDAVPGAQRTCEKRWVCEKFKEMKQEMSQESDSD